MFDRLADPDLYIASAERVRARQLRAGDTRALCHGGPRLAAMTGSIESLGQRLALEVSRGRYVFSPVLRREARIEGKVRALYVASPLDDIVLGALAHVLAATTAGALSGRVFSYQRGRSAKAAIDEFRAYLCEHCRTHPEPRSRGLYVVRRDVRGYGDAIPSGPESRLWLQLTDALRAAGIDVVEPALAWLVSAFRPQVQSAPQLLERPTRGVPTGSPLQPLACNLYLTPLDRVCEAVPAGFYARYGDDVVFAHPDAEVTRATLARMDRCIAELGLELSADKCSAAYFTGAGRPSEQANFRGVSSIDYLGVRVGFRGTVGLKREKLSALLSDVRARLTRSRRLLQGVDHRTRIQTLCALVNSALDPAHPAAHVSAQSLRALVDDRAQLRDIDYKLARLLAQALAGQASVRAFRRYPPRVLREQGGLQSLVQTRNHVGRLSA